MSRKLDPFRKFTLLNYSSDFEVVARFSGGGADKGATHMHYGDHRFEFWPIDLCSMYSHLLIFHFPVNTRPLEPK